MNIRMQKRALSVAFFALTMSLGAMSMVGAASFMRTAQQAAPLHFAAIRGDLDAVRALLATGAGRAQLNQQLAGKTPLHGAARSGHEPVVRLFLEHGAVVDAVDQNGCTPLFLAVESNKGDVARLLLAHGANPNVKNVHGETILGAAALYNDASISQLLLEASASVYTVNQHGHTPLYMAAALSNGSTARILVNYGADMDVRDFHGNYPSRGDGLMEFYQERLRAIRAWAGHLQGHGLLSDIVNSTILNKMVFTDNQRRRFEALGA